MVSARLVRGPPDVRPAICSSRNACSSFGDLFKDFPTLRMIIPHGGGAVPFHWGRYRGLAQDMKRPPLPELMKNNVFFDTCVYHQAGIDLLMKVVPHDNILFGSEMVSGGAFHMPPDGSGFRLQPTNPSSLTQRFSSAMHVSGVTPGVCGS